MLRMAEWPSYYVCTGERKALILMYTLHQCRETVLLQERCLRRFAQNHQGRVSGARLNEGNEFHYKNLHLGSLAGVLMLTARS